MRYIISATTASLALGLSMPMPAWAGVPRVVTDIHPVHALVAQVMGDLGTPDLLLERGASEHDFQLRPSQAAGLADADLVVWIGPELTPWLERALDGIGGDAARLGLLVVPGTVVRDYSGDGSGAAGAQDLGAHGADDAHDDAHDGDEGHDHGQDHGHDHGHDHADAQGQDDGQAHGYDHGHDHAHAGTDPHAWLDPDNAGVWLAAIAAELAALDPENAAVYGANAKAALARIAAVDAELTARLAPVRGRPLVVYHDAYGYFAAHYGLDIFGSVALGDATAPGAARLAALRDGVAAGGAVCLFPEAQHDATLIAQLAEGTGARVGPPLDPNGSLQDPGPGAWEGTLRALAAALADCASG